ncbi:MAG: hypothetical protein D3910_13740, partial [Candidatus Electrothrix sp. ATG2]|nr:hypothetical protein [Candidatus Electrothrix sp. ATG2]
KKNKALSEIKVKNAVKAPLGYCWVELDATSELLLENDLITNDLRVCIPLLRKAASKNAYFDQSGQIHSDAVSPLKKLAFSPEVMDSRGATVSCFRTETRTREVASWVQPLIVPSEPLEIRLTFSRLEGERVFAVEKRTQPGLLGHQLWFPAKTTTGTVIYRVATSGEGGRFWQYRVNIVLQETEAPNKLSPYAVWMKQDELSGLVMNPLRTSLELRMAWSLVIASHVR